MASGDEAEHVDLFVDYDGGMDEPGHTMECPVVIPAIAPNVGVPQEYAYLSGRYGNMGKDWTVDARSLALNVKGRSVETFRIRLRDGSQAEVHFDITAFYHLNKVQDQSAAANLTAPCGWRSGGAVP